MYIKNKQAQHKTWLNMVLHAHLWILALACCSLKYTLELVGSHEKASVTYQGN